MLIAIEDIDITTARALSGRRKPRCAAYADQWHVAARRENSRAIDTECRSPITPTIRAIADALFARESECLAYLGFDEAAALWVGGRDACVRSSLPRSAGTRSHALSLAIELVATLTPGDHDIAVGRVNAQRALFG